MKDAYPNYTLTILSVSLVLFLLGVYALIYVHPDLIIDRLKEELQIVVELEDDISSKDQQLLQDTLSQLEWVRPNTLQWISASEAAREMRFELGPLAQELDVRSPFSDLFLFSVHAHYYEPVTLELIKAHISRKEGVDQVYYQTDANQNLEAAVKMWSKYAVYLGIIFGIVAFILVYNTLKLALFSRRKTILTLDMVGARKGFIRKPFILKSILHGTMAALLAIAAIVLGLFLLGREFEGIYRLFQQESFLLWLAGMLLFGMILQALSTRIIMHRFLSGRLQED
jgi:cell division transport system permease protein